MKIVTADEWAPDGGIILEDAADQAVRSTNHVLVIAGPGAGKTELLAQKASFLFQTNTCKAPKKILAISFKKDAADNLRERVEKRCGPDTKDRFSSMTYDAFAKSLLDHFLYALPPEYQPSSNYLVNDEIVIDAAFRKAGYYNPLGLPSGKLKSTYDRILASVNLPFSDDSLGVKVWRHLIRGFDDYQATLSFKMISILADFIIQTNPKIQRALQLTYGFVFLDEFQDTTEFQYSFVKHCFCSSSTKITAVGDNKQRIMLWAGAMKGIFNAFFDEFHPDGRRLLRNYRSAPRLISLQKEMYDSLKERKTEVYPADKWNPDDGNIELIIADNEKVEACAIADDIQRKIAEGVAPHDICILCKQLPSNYCLDIISELERRELRARIEIDYQDLIKEPIVELILDIISCALNRKQPQKWENIESTVLDIWNVDTSQGSVSFDKVQSALYELTEDIQKTMHRERTVDAFNEILSKIRTLLDDSHLKSHYPEYHQGNYLDEQLDKFRLLFTRELESSGNWLLAVENFIGIHSIPIMTIHKSKGLEFSAVYFIGLEDSAFWNFSNQPDEDRCAFFVAISRAKQSVTFTFCKQRSTFRYPDQSHKVINEFFDLLQKPGFANVKLLTS